jgi:hypothetical protein
VQLGLPIDDAMVALRARAIDVIEQRLRLDV